MKFNFIKKQPVKIGQIIEVNGRKMRVECYSHTGRNVVVTTLESAPKFERILCVMTDEPFIEEKQNG